MGPGKHLGRRLSKVQDLRLDWQFFLDVKGLEVDRILISYIYEHIQTFSGLDSLLLVPKDQVYPVIDVATDVVALNRPPESRDVEVWIISCPQGEFHVVNPPGVLHAPEVVPVGV